MDLSQKPDTQDSLPKEEPGDEQRETKDPQEKEPTLELETAEEEQRIPDPNDKAVDEYYVYMNYTFDIYAKIKNCNVIFFWSLTLAEKFTILLLALISSVIESPEKALEEEEKETPKYPKIRKILYNLNPCRLVKLFREMIRKLLEFPSPVTNEEMSAALNSLEKIYEDTLPPIESRIGDASPAMSSLETDGSADDLACGSGRESPATPPNGEISLRWRAYLLHKEVANRLVTYVGNYINSLPVLPTLLKKLSSPISVLWRFTGAPVIAWLSNLKNSRAGFSMCEFFEMPEEEDEPGPFYMLN